MDNGYQDPALAMEKDPAAKREASPNVENTAWSNLAEEAPAFSGDDFFEKLNSSRVEPETAPETEEETGPEDEEKRADAEREKMEFWQIIQEKMQRIQDQMMDELRTYYEINHEKSPEERSGTLPKLVEGFEGKINESLDEASSPDDFIQTIIDKMTEAERKEVKDRIRAAAEG